MITSPSGAAVRDVLSVLRRRFPLLEVERAAGAGAGRRRRRADPSPCCCAPIASGRYDVHVLARGGGSLEDLWAFNDEALARAIAASPVPVVSAIGHETDFTLADFAADLRAPTPSAAAELLVPDAAGLSARLSTLRRQLQAQQANALRQRMQRLDRSMLRLQAQRPQARLEAFARRATQARLRLHNAMQRRLERQHAVLRHADATLRAQHPQRRLERLRQRLAELQPRPRALLTRQLQGLRMQLLALEHRPRACLVQRLQHDAVQLRGLARSLHAISPLATVARGYSILQRGDGHVVRSIDEVAVGDQLRARVHDGELAVRVEGATPAR